MEVEKTEGFVDTTGVVVDTGVVGAGADSRNDALYLLDGGAFSTTTAPIMNATSFSRCGRKTIRDAFSKTGFRP